MKPAPLTELWSATYLSVEALLLVFAVGIPGLVLQLITPEDVRRVVERNGWSTGRVYLVVVTLVVGVMGSTIWVLHEEGHPSKATPLAWVAALGCTGVMLACFALSVFFVGKYSRRGVIRRLKARVFKLYAKEGIVDESAVEDIAYLGEHGDCGSEKDLALTAFGSVANTVQSYARENTYTCTTLQDVVAGIVRTVDNARVAGDERDVERAIEQLAGIDQSARGRRPPMGDRDGAYARQAMCELAGIALEHGWDQVVLSGLNHLRLEPVSIYSLGRAAIQRGRVLVVSAALSRLEDGLECGPEAETHRFLVLGMCAHLKARWWAGGVRATVAVERLRAMGGANIERVKLGGIEWFNSQGWFDDVDALVNVRLDHSPTHAPGGPGHDAAPFA